MEDGSYTAVSGEPVEVHLERMSLIRQAVLDVLTGMSLEEFRTLRLTEENGQVTPEWVVEHLAQHEAEHRGQIWEARVTAEAALGIDDSRN